VNTGVRTMASPERRPIAQCLRSLQPGICRNCGAPGSHVPIFARGIFCARCCPCAKPAVIEQRKPAAPRPPTQARRMAPGSQWIDLGFGRPDSDWYRDDVAQRAERVLGPRGGGSWVPRRDRWFPARSRRNY
jgi:hypothetical protein